MKKKTRLTLDQKKNNLRQRLLKKLEALSSDVDILSCTLLANISENELPLSIIKNGITEIKKISDADAAITEEAEIRSALLKQYKTIIAFAGRLNAVEMQVQLNTLEREINEAL